MASSSMLLFPPNLSFSSRTRLASANTAASTPRTTGCRPFSVVASASSRALQALIFDCDGVILESEHLHRQAYNDAFAHFNVRCPSSFSTGPLNWSPEFYDELQNLIGGGKPKMRWYFKEHGWPTSTIFYSSPENDDDRAKLIDILQPRPDRKPGLRPLRQGLGPLSAPSHDHSSRIAPSLQKPECQNHSQQSRSFFPRWEGRRRRCLQAKLLAEWISRPLSTLTPSLVWAKIEQYFELHDTPPTHSLQFAHIWIDRYSERKVMNPYELLATLKKDSDVTEFSQSTSCHRSGDREIGTSGQLCADSMYRRRRSAAIIVQQLVRNIIDQQLVWFIESAVELAMETSRVISAVHEDSADEDSADEKRCARGGMSCDDISLDVITISSWLSADEEKRKRRCDVTQESAGSLHPDARGSDVVEEIFSRELQCSVASIQAQRIVEVSKRSSRSDKSAAKQLTTYEELSKMVVNC
ncbi:haloacid dehalogenase-like hydrolase domain-containing protein-like [Dorcoceras hygrometricum]|uniref:Haloacid dehalogenase-like hydrolase domain-containing protein-like n=1 Tax=Dorcoceras hygrometricum TaxID=472368 RepID=A0A2Z7CPU9_9LAMI|nr:haloacid dehalogenase-like hydrolase domain-containing protein-like [Dorcoceras hygrometricum]